ncbi:MAG: VIT1/CCC1 transporter family protein [Egibacteraceae bacterium]
MNTFRTRAHSRYRRQLTRELEAAAVYRALAALRSGEEHDSLVALARAEERHAQHWVGLLGEAAASGPSRLGPRARLLGWIARRISSLLVLAVVQRAELDGSYDSNTEATAQMAADERIHAWIVEGLARRRRARASGLFRASVFGINDGLVSNVSLVLGMAGSGAQRPIVLLAGLAGLLSGALSMAAGEYVSVRSQRELLSGGGGVVEPAMLGALASGDIDRLTGLLRSEGMPDEEAGPFAAALLRNRDDEAGQSAEVVGSALGAALSSFAAFALGAVVPVVPYLMADGGRALAGAVVLTGAALFAAGATAGVLTGGSLRRRGLRQLAIGGTAAAATYGLGTLLGVTIS